MLSGEATVGVIGAGGLGLWAIKFLKQRYPDNVKVVAIDVNVSTCMCFYETRNRGTIIYITPTIV